MESNHECYVSLEVAKLLKQAGFDWKVRYMYRNNNPTLCICTETPYRNMPKPNKCPMYWQYGAPTLDVAQRWLREVKRINVEVMYLFEPCNHYFARACYLDTNTPLYIPNPLASTIYEEAQEAGIKKALEIILKKGE